MNALLLGATGLVGSHLLRRLAADPRWARVTTLGRKPMHAASSHHLHHVVDFDHLDAEPAERFAADAVFCTLGTTIKQAGSEDAFRRVDFDYPVAVGRLAKAQGARHFLLVSSLGADAGSRLFYNRTKGEVEDALAALGFPALSLFRPSLLTGDRKGVRVGERLGQVVLTLARPLLLGPLSPLRPTPADAVAAAMVRVGAEGPRGTRVYEPDAIRRLAAPVRPA